MLGFSPLASAPLAALDANIVEASENINQVAAARVAKHDLPHSNDLEDFLDQMADKYRANADKTAERIFGKADFLNTEYMMQLEKK